VMMSAGSLAHATVGDEPFGSGIYHLYTDRSISSHSQHIACFVIDARCDDDEQVRMAWPHLHSSLQAIIEKAMATREDVSTGTRIN
jgi:hypothetical protein